jgi:SAM-dependent methyltransferase
MPEWWEEFFDRAWQDVQLGSWTDDDNRVAADRIERALHLGPGADVLDVPCGDGRIALELAARGHRTTGVDITERFLAEARANAERRSLDVRFQHGDMRDLPFEGEFDAVVNFGGSFGYFDDEGSRRTVAAASRALRPDGRFLVDVLSPETLFTGFREQLWRTVGEIVVIIANRYDHENGRIESDWTIIAEDGRRTLQHSSMRLYTYRELKTLLLGEGFGDVEGFDDDLKPFGLGASRLLAVATKA